MLSPSGSLGRQRRHLHVNVPDMFNRAAMSDPDLAVRGLKAAIRSKTRASLAISRGSAGRWALSMPMTA